MPLDPSVLRSLITTSAEQIIASAPELTALDQAIGDVRELDFARRQVRTVRARLFDDPHGLAAGNEFRDQVRADEASPAGDGDHRFRSMG